MTISNEKNDVLRAVNSNIIPLIDKIDKLYNISLTDCFNETREYISKLYDNGEIEFRKLDKFICSQVYCSQGRGDSPIYHFLFESTFEGMTASSLFTNISASFMISENNKNNSLSLDSKYLHDITFIVNPVGDKKTGKVTFTLPIHYFANYLSNEEYEELSAFIRKYDFVPRLSVTAYIFSENTIKKIVKEIIAIIFKYIPLNNTISSDFYE